MPLIQLETLINARLSDCFDASRNIDIHTQSMAHSGEKAVAGRTSGLISLNETVTWRARHLGIWWHLTSQITQMDPPYSFTDEMIRGPFKKMKHKHLFIAQRANILMIDEFEYESPLGVLGKLADLLFLKRYMRNLLTNRNACLKVHAEGLVSSYSHK
ncbi:MAG: SRPBCC family protein [Chitinophagaceae bacterium]|nr:SRPBCC family protein [Chitinophagaceae bacterium]